MLYLARNYMMKTLRRSIELRKFYETTVWRIASKYHQIRQRLMLCYAVF